MMDHPYSQVFHLVNLLQEQVLVILLGQEQVLVILLEWE